MSRLPSLSVVVPIYNEEHILSHTVAAIFDTTQNQSAFRLHELILAENGSRDRTLAIARELAAANPAIKVLSLKVADYGAAMKAGFMSATGQYIANVDADYYDFEFVKFALQADADIVIAAKNIHGSTDARALVRRLGSRCFGWMVRRVLDVRTTETHGIKLYRRAAIEPLLPQVKSTKDLFDTELVARAEKGDLKIVELPISTQEMRHSRSGILRRIPRTLWGLLRLRFELRKPQLKPR